MHIRSGQLLLPSMIHNLDVCLFLQGRHFTSVGLTKSAGHQDSHAERKVIDLDLFDEP